MGSKDSGQLAALREYHGLGDEVLRSVRPITVDQIQRFRHNPDVRLPDKMVGFERMGKLVTPGVRDFIRTEDGELAFIVPVKAGMYEFIAGSESVLLLLEYSSSACQLLDIVDGEPLWMERPANRLSKCHLMLDDLKIVCKSGIENVTVQHDGSIIFTHSRNAGMVSIGVWHNARVEDYRMSNRVVTGFFKDDNDRQWIIYRGTSGSGESNVVGILNGGTIDRRYSGTNILGKVEGQRSGKPAFVASTIDEKSIQVREVVFGECELRFSATVGQLPFLSQCICLPNGCNYAYIGQAAHKQQCWVVNDVSEHRPAFNWVSQLFQDPEHGLCYWGIVGDALITMRF